MLGQPMRTPSIKTGVVILRVPLDFDCVFFFTAAKGYQNGNVPSGYCVLRSILAKHVMNRRSKGAPRELDVYQMVSAAESYQPFADNEKFHFDTRFTVHLFRSMPCAGACRADGADRPVIC